MFITLKHTYAILYQGCIPYVLAGQMVVTVEPREFVGGCALCVHRRPMRMGLQSRLGTTSPGSLATHMQSRASLIDKTDVLFSVHRAVRGMFCEGCSDKPPPNHLPWHPLRSKSYQTISMTKLI